MEVGFCGLGLMGVLMIWYLLVVGYCVSVWNCLCEKVEVFVKDGV